MFTQHTKSDGVWLTVSSKYENMDILWVGEKLLIMLEVVNTAKEIHPYKEFCFSVPFLFSPGIIFISKKCLVLHAYSSYFNCNGIINSFLFLLASMIHTKGSLFFTRRTIFTDSSSKSSSILSNNGGRTGSKFF